jgi:hypothetical protein
MDARYIAAAIFAVILVIGPKPSIAQRPPATRPAESDAQRVRRLEAENVKLRQLVTILSAENAKLRQEASAQSAASVDPQPAPGASATADKPVAKTYTSVTEFVHLLPEGRHPADGQKWDDFLVSRAQQWLEANAIGQVMTTTVKFDGNGGITDGKFDISVDGVTFNYGGLDYYGTMSALVPEALADKAVKLKKGDMLRLTGKIGEVKIDRLFMDSTVGVSVELIDASFEPAAHVK